MVTPFTLFCLLLAAGGLAQAAGLFLARRTPCAAFWLLASGALCMVCAALIDNDYTLLLGQGLASAVIVRLRWGHREALLEAALPLSLRQHWRQHKGLYKQTLLFALAILAVLCLPLLAPDTNALHAFISRVIDVQNPENAWRAKSFYVGLAALLSCVAVPRQALSFVAGLLFGAWLGALLATLATTLGCAMAFGLSRTVTYWLARRQRTQPETDPEATATLRRFAARYRSQYTRLSGLLHRAPFLMAILLRLFPSGNNLLFSLLAGAMRLPALSFVSGSGVGYIPQNVIFALLGSGVYSDGNWRLAAGAALFAAATLLGVWAWKRTPQS